ncbi:pyrroline-5-carboxylate reductase 3 isoform X1 [Cynocephalus volans]|uniref:pyrroline-5-carboxylate reductase 3 isoform X1 n=1 Tax=Cynocephalus volans TaxID=110931 RepID=UPI002FC9AAA3
MAAAAEAGPGPWRVGFVGAGRMAEAIAQGLVRAGKVEAQHVLASAPTDRNLCRFRALGCQTTHSNQEVLRSCLLIIFATKPHVLPAVLAEVAPVVTTEHILVSVAAGVSLSTLEELLPPNSRVLRVSPNLPCVVQEGAMAMARGHHAGSSEAKLLKDLLEACGQCEEVPEAHMDIHTGLSGSGVAFVLSLLLAGYRVQGVLALTPLPCCDSRCACSLRPWLKAPSRWACPVAWPTASLPRPCWGQPRCCCRRGSTRPSCGQMCARRAAPPSTGFTRWSRGGCERPP